MLHPLIEQHLTRDDDPNFWDVATTKLLAEAASSAVDAIDEVYVQIGCCHHWISPHRPIHWTAGGGFAWPFGYDKTTSGWSYRALPEFTWSEMFRWTSEGWEPGRTGKRCLVFRVAIPGRTARRLQAAVHTIWIPHSPTTNERALKLFGFRKRRGKWWLIASQTFPRKRRKRRV